MFLLNLGIPTILYYFIIILLIILGIIMIALSSKKSGPDATAIAVFGLALIIAAAALLAIPYQQFMRI